MKRYAYLLCLICLMVCSCKSGKYTNKPAAGEVKTVAQLIAAVRAHEPVFKQAQAGKISVSLKYQERTMNFGGSIGLIVDSLACLSVQPLFGIELFRAELRTDSALLIDKMNRRYAVMPLQYRNMDVNFRKIVQDMVCNRLFVAGDLSKLNSRQATMQKTENSYLLSFNDPEYEVVHYDFQVDAATFRITEAAVGLDGYNAAMRVRYADMRTVDGIDFPHTLDFSVTVPDGRQLECSIELLRLSFQDKVTVTQANLSRYRQVELTDLLNK